MRCKARWKSRQNRPETFWRNRVVRKPAQSKCSFSSGKVEPWRLAQSNDEKTGPRLTNRCEEGGWGGWRGWALLSAALQLHSSRPGSGFPSRARRLEIRCRMTALHSGLFGDPRSQACPSAERAEGHSLGICLGLVLWVPLSRPCELAAHSEHTFPPYGAPYDGDSSHSSTEALGTNPHQWVVGGSALFFMQRAQRESRPVLLVSNSARAAGGLHRGKEGRWAASPSPCTNKSMRKLLDPQVYPGNC